MTRLEQMLMNLMNRFETCGFETCFQSYRTQLKAQVWLHRHVSTCEPTLHVQASNHAGHQKPGLPVSAFGNPKPTMKGCQNHYSTQPLENKLNILYTHIYTYRQSSLESSTDINIYTDLKLQNAVCWKNELQV